LRFRLSVLLFLQYAVPGAMLPLYSVRLTDLGFSELATALCCATQAMAVVGSSLAAGQLADRYFSAERTLAACALLAALDLWVLAEMAEPVGVFLATFFFWLVAGPLVLLGTTIALAHLQDPNKQFGPIRMWGTVGWLAIGWVVGAWLTSPVWGAALPEWLHPGLRAPELADGMRIGGLAALVLAGFTLLLPPTAPRKSAAHALAPLRALGLLRDRSFAVYCACVLGSSICFPFTTQSTPLLLKKLGVTGAWLGPTQTVSQTTEIILLGLLPALLLRLGVRRTMVLGLAAWMVAMTILAVGRPLELVVASMTLNGLYVSGFLVAGQVYLNTRADDGMRASVQGLFSCCNGLGLLLGHLGAGWLRHRADGDLSLTFGVGAVLTTTLLVIFLIGFHPTITADRAPSSAPARP
jgi:predicted MFS family arabinose efflux permease